MPRRNSTKGTATLAAAEETVLTQQEEMLYTELRQRIGAAVPVTLLESPSSEEETVVKRIFQFVLPRFRSYGQQVFVYSVASGMRLAVLNSNGLPRLIDGGELEKKIADLDGNSSDDSQIVASLREALEVLKAFRFTRDPVMEPLQKLQQASLKGIFIFCDFHHYLAGQRKLLTAVRTVKDFAFEGSRSGKRAIFIAPHWDIDADLDGCVSIIRNPLPEAPTLRAELDRNIKAAIAKSAARRVDGDSCNFVNTIDCDEAVRAAGGLTTAELAQAFRLYVYGRSLSSADSNYYLDEGFINELKRLKTAKLVELGVKLCDPPDVVPGGLDNFKSWIEDRKSLFWGTLQTSFKIPAPKGVLIVGFPGGGKSLMAKQIAALWNLSILDFDFGTMLGSLVGESEGKLRRFFQVVEAARPCVVRIDEIEKQFDGPAQSGGGDSGVGKRMLQMFLTWMQERPDGIFIVATANDITVLRDNIPELLRPGRFDQTFFAGRPTTAERIEILEAHLSKQDSTLPSDDLERIAQACNGFVGAEIAQVVQTAAMQAAFSGSPRITLDHLLTGVRQIIPITSKMGNKALALEQWAEQHAMPASTHKPEDFLTTGDMGRELSNLSDEDELML